MKIRKSLVAQSIQDHKKVWGRMYISYENEVHKFTVKRNMVEYNGHSTMHFYLKEHLHIICRDLDGHLCCWRRFGWYSPNSLSTLTASGSLMFKNYWHAFAFNLKMKNRGKRADK